MKYFFLLLACVSLLTAKTIEDFETEKKVDQLLLLMQKRLSLMHEVAKAKWNQHLPIEDKAREAAILTSLSQKVPQNKDWIVAFFKAQIESAKQMQRADFACWQNEGQALIATDLSLNSDLRAYIDRLNDEMYNLLTEVSYDDLKAKVSPVPISNREADNIPQNVWNTAISSLN